MIHQRLAEFELFVLYYSVVLYDSNIHNTFNDWRDKHARQGFSWRPGNVSFGTLDTLYMSIYVQLAEAQSLRSDTIRAIRVPFCVTPKSRIKVAVVTEDRDVDVPPGEYALTYEHGTEPFGEKMWCVFTFVADDAAEPAILIADPELCPPSPLLMEADPA